MSIATLVIGLGGTGVLTLRALKKLYEELPQKERVPAAFLVFDFDRSALVSGDQEDRFAKLDESEFFYLNPRQLQDLLRNLDRALNGEIAWKKILEWFPEKSHVQIPASEVEANGASQLRVLGRLGFFQNDEIIESTIRHKLNEIGTEIDQIRLSEEKRVILVSSVAGGTGAGMLIDMAYIARRQTIRPRIFTYLLLPEVFQDVDSGGRIFQNSYALLKELAYLKDQQLPFQADYYRIPPLDIAVGGEEPFARIYLCRGEGFAGADAIKDATLSIAQAILAQLQATVQEKTLSIVSNTLSADPQDQQKRRRTHCFSTAGSFFLNLKKLEITRDEMFRLVVQAIRSSSFLEELYDRELDQLLDQVAASGRRGEVGTERPPESKSRDERQPEGEASSDAETWARDLEKVWNREIGSQSRQAQKWIMEDLSQRLSAARAKVDSRDRNSLAQGIEDIARLKALILVNFTEETYPENLNKLRNLTRFPDYERSLKGEVETFLRSLEGSFGITSGLKKRALYERLQKLAPRFNVKFLNAPSPMREKIHEEWEKREVEFAGLKKLHWWQRVAHEHLDAVQKANTDCDSLESALTDENFQRNIADIVRVRAIKNLQERIRENLKSANQVSQESDQIWSNLPIDERLDQFYEPPEELRTKVVAMLQKELPELELEARLQIKKEDDPETRQGKLMSLVENRLGAKRDWGALYKLEKTVGDTESTFRDALVRCRQQVFERRTPNPQRKGFGLIMVPQGFYWPHGDRESLRAFLESAAMQILGCRCQVEDYQGSRIWIYYEDLFNPPEHIRNLDEYFRSYSSQKYKELFHIDRRMLDNPVFREINSGTSTLVLTCGNPGCRENISSQPRTELVCRKCGLPIRSRCGNERCTENNLHNHPQGTAKACPICEGFNHAAWWRCERHGKIAVEIPIDKPRCPLCIEEHRNNPVAWPETQISVRPDLLDSVPCPRCEDLHMKNTGHAIFYIPKPLLRFYRHGVNGHDRPEFLRLAELFKLPGKCRCPNCRTLLIPIHHQQASLHKARRSHQ